MKSGITNTKKSDTVVLTPEEYLKKLEVFIEANEKGGIFQFTTKQNELKELETQKVSFEDSQNAKYFNRIEEIKYALKEMGLALQKKQWFEFGHYLICFKIFVKPSNGQKPTQVQEPS